MSVMPQMHKKLRKANKQKCAISPIVKRCIELAKQRRQKHAEKMKYEVREAPLPFYKLWFNFFSQG
jgi:hypothetical protein